MSLSLISYPGHPESLAYSKRHGQSDTEVLRSHGICNLHSQALKSFFRNVEMNDETLSIDSFFLMKQEGA